MFTVMGALAQATLPWVSLVATVPAAAGLEYAQKRIPKRTYDRVELLANILGVVLGAGLFELATVLRRR
jgi:VanZ family protein